MSDLETDPTVSPVDFTCTLYPSADKNFLIDFLTFKLVSHNKLNKRCLFDVLSGLTVQSYLTASFQKAEAENLFLMTEVHPERTVCPIPMTPPPV